MTPTKAPSVAGSQSGASVPVPIEAAARALNHILRKPGPRGKCSVRAQNKRRAIGQGTCDPGGAVALLLAENNCVDEFCDALRAFFAPPEKQSTESLTDLALRYNADSRTIGESIDDLLTGRADSHDLAVIGHAGAEIEQSAEALSVAASRARFRPELQRRIA